MERRPDRKGTRFTGEVPQADELPSVAVGVGHVAFVTRDMERRSLPAICGFDFDEAWRSVWFKAEDVIAPAIAVFDRGPTDARREIVPADLAQAGALVRKNALLARAAKFAVSSVPGSDVVFASHRRHKRYIDYRRFVRMGGRRSDPEWHLLTSNGSPGAGTYAAVMTFPPSGEPIGASVEPAQYGIDERVLKSRGGFISDNLRLAETEQDRADILVFEFDRAFASVRKLFAQGAVVFGLVVTHA